MIVLNLDRQIIQIDSWDDIASRPSFTKNLDPKAHKLDAIIGRYLFKDKVRCGLSDCHTPHAKGYIVVTKDGRETNIGKDCGRTYFGVDFETLSAKFERDLNERENRERVTAFVFRVEELRDRLARLRKQPKGADWIHKLSRPLVEPTERFPQEVVRRLREMVRLRNPALIVSREATAEEIDNMEAMQGRKLARPHFLEETIAEIAGLDALYAENDLRQLLVFELEEKLKSIEAENIDTMTFEVLRRWAKWIGTVDGTLENAERSIESGRRLLTRDNLAPLDRIISERENRAEFRRYLKQLDA